MMGRNFKNYENVTVVLILKILKCNVYIDLGDLGLFNENLIFSALW